MYRTLSHNAYTLLRTLIDNAADTHTAHTTKDDTTQGGKDSLIPGCSHLQYLIALQYRNV